MGTAAHVRYLVARASMPVLHGQEGCATSARTDSSLVLREEDHRYGRRSTKTGSFPGGPRSSAASDSDLMFGISNLEFEISDLRFEANARRRRGARCLRISSLAAHTL